LKLLFDTNVFIPAEPTSPNEVEDATAPVAKLLQAAMAGKHQVYVHPDSIRELLRDRDSARRELRRTLIQKYIQLPAPPAIPEQFRTALGSKFLSKHDEVDLLLLAAVEANSVDYLVTEDRRLLTKATNVGLAARAIPIDEALKALRALFSTTPAPPPAVRKIVAHQLIESDPIFDGLRQDYQPEFDGWLKKCKLEHRDAWIIEDDGSRYNGLCIVKNETTGEHNLTGKVLKICTFKISFDAFGKGYGELLLRTVFEYAAANKYDALYVEVLAKYRSVISLLDTFGFEATTATTSRSEKVLVKKLSFSKAEVDAADPLEFNIRFGPIRVKFDGAQVFVVPIRPDYYKVLFPSVESQQELFQGVHPSGNAIRKAYLCHSRLRKMKPGSVLLFYRSKDTKAICSLGVAEALLRSSDPMEIARFVGTRTVYPYDRIKKMCRKPILALLFRHAYSLPTPIGLRDLTNAGALKSAPQSIVAINNRGISCLQNRLQL
jgi:ribosomal protein S18 acetylase RimI-like enzyme